MNRFKASLRWIPPTVDYEEETQQVDVAGGDAATVRQVLERQIKKIEEQSGWACELTLTPTLRLAGSGGRT